MHTRAITGDKDGIVYIATTCGIAMIDPDGNLNMMEDEAIAEANMRDLKMGSDGIIYGITNFGDLWFTSTRQGVMKVVPNQFSDRRHDGGNTV